MKQLYIMANRTYRIVFRGKNTDPMRIPAIFTKSVPEHEMILIDDKDLSKSISRVCARDSLYRKVKEEVESPGYMVDYFALNTRRDTISLAMVKNLPLIQISSTSKHLLVEKIQDIGLSIDDRSIRSNKYDLDFL